MLKNVSNVLLLATLWFFKTFFKDPSLPNIDIHYASELLTWLFADDTSLVASADSIISLKSKMNSQISKVQDWLLANKLSVHYV